MIQKDSHPIGWLFFIALFIVLNLLKIKSRLKRMNITQDFRLPFHFTNFLHKTHTVVLVKISETQIPF